MTVESVSYIDGLNTAWPDGDTGQKFEGDDIFRLLKRVLKQTFPNCGVPHRLTYNHDTPYVVTTTENHAIHGLSYSAYAGFYLPNIATLSPGFTVYVFIANGLPQVGVRSLDGTYVSVPELYSGWIHEYILSYGYWACRALPLNQLTAAKSQVDALTLTLSAPQNTRMVLHQAAAPAGWALDWNYQDRVLRINNIAGAGVGGAWAISGLNGEGTTLVEAHLPNYAPRARVGTASVPAGFGYNIVYLTPGVGGTPGYIDAFGENVPHGHPISSNGSWRPAYTDVILVNKL
jgi:hypothetical protein